MKSYALQFFLTFLFGPLGLLYSGASVALFIILFTIILDLTLPLTSDVAFTLGVLIWLICQPIGFMCVASYNKKFEQKVKDLTSQSLAREGRAS